MARTVAITVAALLLSTPVYADPIQDAINWCGANNQEPRSSYKAMIMPDNFPRGTRTPADLLAEARKAKAAGNCNAAARWVVHCVEHDAAAQKAVRDNVQGTCNAL